MKKTLLITGSSLLLALATAALLAVHPTLAKGEEAKSSGAEVKVDNFTFSPDTLTVPVNGAVTWVNKDDIPHVITSNDGLFKFKAWIQTKIFIHLH